MKQLWHTLMNDSPFQLFCDVVIIVVLIKIVYEIITDDGIQN